MYVRALGRSFQAAGVRALTATSGMSALRAAEETPPQLAIVDLYMTGMDGIEVVARLRKMNDSVFIVLMSAASLPPALTMRGIRAGADECIEKGPNARRLLRLVENDEPLEAEVSVSSTMTLEAAETNAISRALIATAGNRTHAALLLGITRQGLQKRLAKRRGDAH